MKTEEIPSEPLELLAQEVVAYELASSVMGIAFGVILIAIGLLIFWLCYRQWSVMDAREDWEGHAIIGAFALVVFGVAGTAAIGVNAPKALKAATAPRLVVLEKVGELLK